MYLVYYNYVKAVAHITGGGLLENIPRVIPDAVRARLNAHWWHVHPVCIFIYLMHPERWAKIVTHWTPQESDHVYGANVVRNCTN